MPLVTVGMLTAGYGIGDTRNTIRVLLVYGTLFVYIVAGKYFVRGLTAGAVKG